MKGEGFLISMNHYCDYCRQNMPDAVHPFTLKLELFPAVEPSLEIKPSEFEGNMSEEMERLINEMAKMEDSEVLRQEKLMYVSYCFTLCPACRERLAGQLERLSPHPD